MREGDEKCIFIHGEKRVGREDKGGGAGLGGRGGVKE